jgi:membrane fusion protein, multidrug efflux system
MNINYLIPALGLALGLFSCSKEQVKTVTPDEIKSAFILKKQAISNTLDLPAELLPYESSEIHAKVEGYVQRVLVDIGDRVKKGQVLIQLEAPEVNARTTQASASFQEVATRYESSRDRYTRILNAAKEQGAISELELVGAKNQFLADSSAWLSAKANSQAIGQLQAYLAIRAPFDGIVTRRRVDVGDFVGNGSPEGLLTVENPSKIRVRVHVPESYVGSLPGVNTLDFSTEAIVNKSYSAKLSRKSGSIDRDTRTELWEYEYDNKAGEIKSGMYATAKLQLNRKENSFKVPNSAVTTSLEKKFVIRLRNGKAEWIDVKEGIAMSDGREIFGDLQEGDTLLVRGTEEIKAGTDVKVKVE